MKKNALIIVAISTFMSGTIFTSCSTSAEKVDHAKSDVRAANKELAKAEAEATADANYKADLLEFRADIEERIAANDKAILDFKERIRLEKKESRVAFTKTMDEIELKNDEMKKRMEEYNDDKKENWEEFKAEYKKDMEAISAKFKTVVLKNSN